MKDETYHAIMLVLMMLIIIAITIGAIDIIGIRNEIRRQSGDISVLATESLTLNALNQKAIDAATVRDAAREEGMNNNGGSYGK